MSTARLRSERNQGGARPGATSPGGVWASERRALTVGLVLAVTLVAFEALAIATVVRRPGPGGQKH